MSLASDSSSVTLSLGNNPGGGTLGGTLTVAAVNGLATFNNLSINAAGSGYTLVATDTTGPGTLTVTSAPFTIDNPPTVATSGRRNAQSGHRRDHESFRSGADSSGESTLTYAWAATTLPSGAAAPASRSTARMPRRTPRPRSARPALRSHGHDQGRQWRNVVTSSVNVTVSQTATSLVVAPAAVVLASGGTQQFTATLLDQFGAALASQPAFTWSATTGSISSSGLFTSAGASATVTATSGSFSGTAGRRGPAAHRGHARRRGAEPGDRHDDEPLRARRRRGGRVELDVHLDGHDPARRRGATDL